MNNKWTISFEGEEMIRILADLNFLVVSLDRIGSAALSDEARKAELYDFVVEGDAFKRLAAIRKSIWVRIDENVPRSTIDAIEERLEDVEKWKLRR